jgi:hypothetical protein
LAIGSIETAAAVRLPFPLAAALSGRCSYTQVAHARIDVLAATQPTSLPNASPSAVSRSVVLKLFHLKAGSKRSRHESISDQGTLRLTEVLKDLGESPSPRRSNSRSAIATA